ncbi:high-affinity Zn(2+) transporter zrt1 [Xylographa soralifera]|nr:high-affinity Zn(2+) transporter zrt1 [Xylographa soralifera]
MPTAQHPNPAPDDQSQMAYDLDPSTNDNNHNFRATVFTLIVVFTISTAATAFPLVAKRVRCMKIPLYVYLFIRYFGASTILATALLHLLDPAYSDMGTAKYDAFTGNRVLSTWYTAIVLISIIAIYALSVGAQHFLELRDGDPQQPKPHHNTPATKPPPHKHRGDNAIPAHNHPTSNNIHHNHPPSTRTPLPPSTRPHAPSPALTTALAARAYEKRINTHALYNAADEHRTARPLSPTHQTATFLALESRTLFHSLLGGLALASTGPTSSSLSWALLAHQPLEGLGFGARLCGVSFKRGACLPWALCVGFGLVAPLGVGEGTVVRGMCGLGEGTEGMVVVVGWGCWSRWRWGIWFTRR